MPETMTHTNGRATDTALFEIVNPSDPYTLETDDWKAACVAVTTLGSGKYALDEVGGDRHMPILFLGGWDAWFEEEFGETLEEAIQSTPKEAVADVLDSVLIGSPQSREDFREGLALIDDPAKKELWRERWHDKRRSSMNNIGERAWRLAGRLRADSLD